MLPGFWRDRDLKPTGIGKWLVEAIHRRDYPVVQGGILLSATIIILVNLIVDVLYGVINPRIRHTA